MENIIRKTASLRSSARGITVLGVVCVTLSACVALLSVMYAVRSVKESYSSIYILDRGVASSGTAAPVDEFKDVEVQDHVVRFHELMFNLSPSTEAIRSNMDRAFIMSDRSAYDFWQDLSEKRFYERMISANISQQFKLDSLRTDTSGYPYRARLYGKLFLIRESNITSYDLVTSCQLVDITRSKTNPHGLIIEKFRVESNEKVGTRRRD